jgi:hypothetical protein
MPAAPRSTWNTSSAALVADQCGSSANPGGGGDTSISTTGNQCPACSVPDHLPQADVPITGFPIVGTARGAAASLPGHWERYTCFDRDVLTFWHRRRRQNVSFLRGDHGEAPCAEGKRYVWPDRRYPRPAAARGAGPLRRGAQVRARVRSWASRRRPGRSPPAVASTR